MALVAIYAAAGFLWAPRLIRSQAEEFVSENYGRKVDIGEIRFNPFTLELNVGRFTLPDADGKPVLSFESLLVNLELSSLWRRGASFKEIAIRRPYARALVRENGEFNVTDLIKPFEEQPGEAAEPSEPPRLFIGLFRMDAGQVHFEDRTLATPYTADLAPLSFELRDFSTTESTDNAYDLHAQADSGATLDWSGSMTLTPFTSQGRFKFANINARRHWAYLREAAGLDVSSGELGFDGSYDVSIDKTTDFKAMLNRLEMADLGIKPIGQEIETARFEKLALSNATFDLAKHTAGVEKIEITGGSVEVWREADGSINLLELTEPQDADVATDEATTATSPSAAESETPITFTAPDIHLQGLVVQVEDRQVTPAIKLMLDPFDLRVTGYSTAPGTTIGIVTEAKINEKGGLKADLRYALDDGKLEGSANLASFDMTVIQPYLDRYTRMDLLSGLLTTELEVTLLADGGFAAAGAVQVDKLRTVDKAQKEDFIKWNLLRAEGFSYDGREAKLRIKTLRMRAPYARVIIAEDETFNIAEIMKPATPAPAYVPSVAMAAPGGPPPAETQVAIDTVTVENGSANFADFWIQPNYAVSIQALNGTIVGLSSDPASRAKLDLDGKVDRYAPATIEGEMNLLSATLFTDIRVQFAGVDMTSVTPYSGRFAGYKIEKGKLSIDVTYHVENRQLDAKQKFVIDQLQLGEKVESPDAVSLPLKLAVALLKDRNGVIDIDLPMTGSLDDPKFRLGPLIWKAFVGLLTKIATAPFALLGKLFGGGEEMNFVDFEPGVTALDPAGQEKMAGLLKALQERPSLQVDVPMTYSEELDAPLLDRRQVDEKLSTLAAGDRNFLGRQPDAEQVAAMLQNPEKRFELLATAHRGDAGDEAPLPPQAAAYEALKKKERTSEVLAAANAEMESALLTKEPVPETALEDLGKARAQSIQEALLGSGAVEASRVFLITEEAKPSNATEGKVRLELSLK